MKNKVMNIVYNIRFLLVMFALVGSYGLLLYGSSSSGEGELAVIQELYVAEPQPEEVEVATMQQAEGWAQTIMNQMGALSAGVLEKIRQFKDQFIGPVIQKFNDAASALKGKFDLAISKANASFAQAKVQFELVKQQLAAKLRSLNEQLTVKTMELKAKAEELGSKTAELNDYRVHIQEQFQEQIKAKVAEAVEATKNQLAQVSSKYEEYKKPLVAVVSSTYEIYNSAQAASKAKDELDQQLKILKRTSQLSPVAKKLSLDQVVDSTKKINEFVKSLDEKVFANLSPLFEKPDEENIMDTIRAALKSYQDTYEVIKYLVSEQKELDISKMQATKPTGFAADLQKQKLQQEEQQQEKQEDRQTAAMKELVEKHGESSGEAMEHEQGEVEGSAVQGEPMVGDVPQASELQVQAEAQNQQE